VGVLNGNNANPDLKWETTYSYNAGFDLSLFGSRVDIVFDWYYKENQRLAHAPRPPRFPRLGCRQQLRCGQQPLG
jgi:outer membrane receptor protein involved in Fe transport